MWIIFIVRAICNIYYWRICYFNRIVFLHLEDATEGLTVCHSSKLLGVYFLSTSYMSNFVILYRKTQSLNIFYSDICCPLAFVYEVKYNFVCWVEKVEFLFSKSCNFPIKNIPNQQYFVFKLLNSSNHTLKINECFESDGLWQSTGSSFLYMVGALTLTFLMRFLHSSREALTLPEGYYTTGASGLLGSRRISWFGSASRKMEESDRGCCHQLLTHIRVLPYIIIVLSCNEKGNIQSSTLNSLNIGGTITSLQIKTRVMPLCLKGTITLIRTEWRHI